MAGGTEKERDLLSTRSFLTCLHKAIGGNWELRLDFPCLWQRSKQLCHTLLPLSCISRKADEKWRQHLLPGTPTGDAGDLSSGLSHRTVIPAPLIFFLVCDFFFQKFPTILSFQHY